jgi:hypothetical protein
MKTRVMALQGLQQQGHQHSTHDLQAWCCLSLCVMRLFSQDCFNLFLTADCFLLCASAAPAASVTATYELTAMICRILDEDEGDGTPGPAAAGTPSGGGSSLVSPGKNAGANSSSSSSNGGQQVRVMIACCRCIGPY